MINNNRKHLLILEAVLILLKIKIIKDNLIVVDKKKVQ